MNTTLAVVAGAIVLIVTFAAFVDHCLNKSRQLDTALDRILGPRHDEQEES